MTGPFQELAVRLHRDALSTSWGFRLQGGKDFKTPLTIQRVFVGSPADGELHRGDVIETVQNHDASILMHKQAQDLIKQAGGSISLRVKRSLQTRARSAPPGPTPQSQGYRSRPAAASSSAAPSAMSGGGHMYGFVPASQPHYGSGGGSHVGGVPREFGHSYAQPAGGGGLRCGPPAPPNMLHKVNDSLNQALWQTEPDGGDPEYQPKSMNQLHDMFSHRDQRPQHDDEDEDYKTVSQLKSMFTPKHDPRGTHAHSPRRKWVKPETIPGTPRTLLEPGWSPGKSMGGGHDYSRSMPRQRSQTSTPREAFAQSQFSDEPDHFRQQAFPQQQLQQNALPHHEDYQPSWKGSLKSSGGPKPWEVREQQQLLPEQQHQQHHHPQQQQQQPQQQQQQQQQLSPSAAAGDVPVHRPRVQNMHYGPGGTQEYQQHSPSSHGDSESARVAHVQYNTPIGLYSKANVEKVLHQQTGGQPGDGTMQVTGPGSKPFNAAQSDVYRLVLEEDAMQRNVPHGGGGGHQRHQPQQQQQQQPQLSPQQQQQQQSQHPQSARYMEQAPGQEMHYHGYMDHSHQSPSMHALESKMDDSMGTSDF